MRRSDVLDERWKLYEAGYSDLEIGHMQGVSNSAIYHWRQHHSLPSNGIQGNRADKAALQQRLELHSQGLHDAAIARKCGISITAVQHWRKKHGLPQNPVLRK